MRAILLLLMVTAACGDKGGNQFELDISVDAPDATSVLIDNKQTLAPVGGTYSQGFATVSAAANVHGTVATIGSDGSVRASAAYELGTYCSAQTPLLRETLNFVEGVDGNGAPTLALGTVECEKHDGTGVIITP